MRHICIIPLCLCKLLLLDWLSIGFLLWLLFLEEKIRRATESHNLTNRYHFPPTTRKQHVKYKPIHDIDDDEKENLGHGKSRSLSLIDTTCSSLDITFQHKTDFVVNNYISTRMTYEWEYPVLGNCNGTSSLIVLDYLKKTWTCLLTQMSSPDEDLSWQTPV